MVDAAVEKGYETFRGGTKRIDGDASHGIGRVSSRVSGGIDRGSWLSSV